MPSSNARSGAITPEVVRHTAQLAQISLTDHEADEYAEAFNSILANAAKLSDAVSADIPMTSHPNHLRNVQRPDEVADLLTREEALANAPETEDGMFRVATILGGEQ